MNIILTSLSYLAVLLVLVVSCKLEFDVYSQVMRYNDLFAIPNLLALLLILALNVLKMLIYKSLVDAPDKRPHKNPVQYLCLVALVVNSFGCSFLSVSYGMESPRLEAAQQEGLTQLRTSVNVKQASLNRTLDKRRSVLKNQYDDKTKDIKEEYAPNIQRHWDTMIAEKTVTFKLSEEYRGPRYKEAEKLWNKAKVAQQSALESTYNHYDDKLDQAMADYKLEVSALETWEQEKRERLSLDNFSDSGSLRIQDPFLVSGMKVSNGVYGTGFHYLDLIGIIAFLLSFIVETASYAAIATAKRYSSPVCAVSDRKEKIGKDGSVPAREQRTPALHKVSVTPIIDKEVMHG